MEESRLPLRQLRLPQLQKEHIRDVKRAPGEVYIEERGEPVEISGQPEIATKVQTQYGEDFNFLNQITCIINIMPHPGLPKQIDIHPK